MTLKRLKYSGYEAWRNSLFISLLPSRLWKKREEEATKPLFLFHHRKYEKPGKPGEKRSENRKAMQYQWNNKLLSANVNGVWRRKQCQLKIEKRNVGTMSKARNERKCRWAIYVAIHRNEQRNLKCRPQKLSRPCLWPVALREARSSVREKYVLERLWNEERKCYKS